MNFHVKFNYRKIRYFDAKIQFLILGTKIQIGGDFGAKIQIPKTILALKNEVLLISKNDILDCALIRIGRLLADVRQLGNLGYFRYFSDFQTLW